MKKGLLILLGLMSSATLCAQSKRKYVNEFLYVGVGARQLAMGKAGVATTNDVYSNYWNPAGLAEVKDPLQVGFMHNFYFQGLANFDFFGLAAKGKNNDAFGFSVLRFGVDRILNTQDLLRNGEVDYSRVTEFSAVDYAFMPSYARIRKQARNATLNVSWGVTGKIIHRRVGKFAKAWGFGFDGGIRVNDYNGVWGFSATMRDITTTFNNWSFNFTASQKDVYYLTGNTIPQNSLELALPRFTLGGFYSFLKSEKFIATAETNFDITTDGKRNTLVRSNLISIDPRIGFEMGMKDDIKKFRALFRFGFYNFQKETKNNGKSGITFAPSLGMGIKIDNLSLDYALVGIGNSGPGLYSNIISLSMGINKEKNAPKKTTWERVK